MSRIIRFLYSLLFFFVPLAMFTQTSEVFEFNKMVLVYALTIAITAAWAAKIIIHKKIYFKKSPVDIFILLFLASQLVSTLLSIDITTSTFGYYSRFNGGLVSSVCYALLFWAYVSNINQKHTAKMIKVLMASALITAVWGILEHFGKSPSCLLIKGQLNTSCWVQDVQNRVFATFGQPNWMAAYLAAVIPLVWAYINKTKNSLLVSTVLSTFFFMAILFTKSRSGLLGFAAAFLLFWFFKLKNNFRKHVKMFIILSTIIFLIFIVFDSPLKNSFVAKLSDTASPAKSVASVPLDETGGTESGEIRKIVWSGALGVWKQYPIFGSGPETFAYAYYQHRPLAHNQVSEWNYVYNKAHNEYLNFLANTGIVGLGAYLLMIVFMLKILGSSGQTHYLAGFVSLLVSNFFGFSVVSTQILFFMYPAFALAKDTYSPRAIKMKLPISKNVALAILVSLAGVGLCLVGRYWYADFLYAKSGNLVKSGDADTAINNIQQAISINGIEALYYSELADAYLSKATALYKVYNPDTNKFMRLADTTTNTAINMSPFSVKLAKLAAARYSDLAEIDPSYVYQEKEVIENLLKLAPTDAGAWYQYALVLTKLGNNKNALEV
ncbi:O-antigen ligase domain-containing protein, partial [Candidatus Microgenomates bacterium]